MLNKLKERRRILGVVEKELDNLSSGTKTKGSKNSSNLRMEDEELKGKEEDDLLYTEIGDSQQRKSSVIQSPKKQNKDINQSWCWFMKIWIWVRK
ncbi:MAG: hypothetical protein EZS28_008423 [Streblomastix strix]|uniref:Uncharacterized protein n=1 Tax=Streblomastix strix TaxID=222440 RepID=A0A5J4WLU0_9EUKA|nr:MAG: hypothetical protein EZS28_008423 [Streblomastix strix]